MSDDAPLLCEVCQEDPALQGIIYAAVIRDDSEPLRCIICGFLISHDGKQLEPVDDELPLIEFP